jgi:hypothetical protein
MGDIEKKIDFDLNKLNQTELLTVFENINSFLKFLEDSKLDLSEEEEKSNE